jgi:RND superfamily putative drug exporter
MRAGSARYGPAVPETWTRAVLRHRGAVLAVWAAVVAAGIAAAIALPGRLATSFAVPGTESQRAQTILERHFGDRPDGTFTVVFTVGHPSDRALQRRLGRELAAAARVVPSGHFDGTLHAGAGILFGDVATTLDLQHAKRWTEPLRRALRGAAAPARVTGQPAIQHDLDPVLHADLRRGEAIALPAALALLLLVLGFSLAALVPFVVGACTIAATLGVVWLLAHELTLVAFVPNLVELVGIGLAVDYSLLVVSRFREELVRAGDVEAAVVRTAATAGRAVVVSGLAVAIGLALLLLVPVPFIRSLGLAGLVVPLASIAAAATLQPVLLALLGRRVIRSRPRAEGRLWERLAAAIMRRPVPYLLTGVLLLAAAAVPAAFLKLTPGSFATLPRGSEAVAGLAALREGAGAGALTPIEIVVDAGAPGAAVSPSVHRAVERLADAVFHDPEAYVTALDTKPPYVDPSRRYARVVVVARHEYGDPAARALVHRLRDRLVPAARFPAGTVVDVGGAPAQGVDYLSRSYGAFPWLVLAVLAFTYLVLLRGFRSLLLPLKALLLNALTVAAVYGLLVVIFEWGAGDAEIEGWIPIVLFAMLFGLSMDYEVFLVSRMREAWDAEHDNRAAVAHGLARTGRIVTAAAAIMVCAFAGLVVGRVEGLRQFGAGLSLAVLVDATLVRAVLVPAAMAVLGRWNWWLPPRVARLARVRSPAG